MVPKYSNQFDSETVVVAHAEVDEPMVAVPELGAVAGSRVAVLGSVLVPMSSSFAADDLEAVEPIVVVVVTG